MSQHAFLELTGTFLDVGILPRILFSFGTEHFILWGLRLPALYRYPPAVGDDSECVSVEFSGSSKMYEGPHPVSSVNLIPWSLLLTVLCSSRTLSQVHWILIITLHLG